MREMPSKSSDIIRDLWSILIGTNGEGLVERFKAFVQESRDRQEKIITRVANIEEKIPQFWTRDQHEHMHEQYVAEEAEKRDRRGMSTRDWIMIAVVVIGIAASPIIDHLLTRGRP